MPAEKEIGQFAIEVLIGHQNSDLLSMGSIAHLSGPYLHRKMRRETANGTTSHASRIPT
jgi:hypothetical protein